MIINKILLASVALISILSFYRHSVGVPMYLLVNRALSPYEICFAGQRGTARLLMYKEVAFMTGISTLQRMVNIHNIKTCNS